MSMLIYYGVTAVTFSLMTLTAFLAFRGVMILQRIALDLETIARAAQSLPQPLNVDRP